MSTAEKTKPIQWFIKYGIKMCRYIEGAEQQ